MESVQVVRDKARPQNLSERLLKVGEAAALLGVHPNTVRLWSDSGYLPALRIGPRGDRRFRLRDVLSRINSHSQPTH